MKSFFIKLFKSLWFAGKSAAKRDIELEYDDSNEWKRD